MSKRGESKEAEELRLQSSRRLFMKSGGAAKCLTLKLAEA